MQIFFKLANAKEKEHAGFLLILIIYICVIYIYIYLPLSRKINGTTFIFVNSLSIELVFGGGSRWTRGAFRRRRLEVHKCNMNPPKKRKLCTTYMLFEISADFYVFYFFVRNLEHNGHMLEISNPVLFLRPALVD